jgi:integrase
MVIRMARFLVAEDPRHELPPDGVFGHHRERRVPYLFSDEEVRLLLAAAATLPLASSAVLRTYWTLLALLVATGMRISEALALRLEDLSGDVLLIRKTKFKKSRLVPLHPTAAAGLNRYLEARRLVVGSDEHFFLNSRGRQLRYRSVRRIFVRLLRQTDLCRPAKPRPCIHGLRHLFAVRALESCPKSRAGVGRHLLALSTYLGHARVADTYWYLQATPTLLAGIARAAELLMEGGKP